MESELIGTLELFVSPTAMQAMGKKSTEKARSSVTKMGQSQLMSTVPSSSQDGVSGSGGEETQECKLQAEAEPSGLIAYLSCLNLHIILRVLVM